LRISPDEPQHAKPRGRTLDDLREQGRVQLASQAFEVTHALDEGGGVTGGKGAFYRARVAISPEIGVDESELTVWPNLEVTELERRDPGGVAIIGWSMTIQDLQESSVKVVRAVFDKGKAEGQLGWLDQDASMSIPELAVELAAVQVVFQWLDYKRDLTFSVATTACPDMAAGEDPDDTWKDVYVAMKLEGLNSNTAGQQAAHRLRSALEQRGAKNVYANVGVEVVPGGNLRVKTLNESVPNPGPAGDIDLLKLKDGAKKLSIGDIINYDDIDYWRRVTIQTKDHTNAKLEEFLEAGTRKKGSSLLGWTKWGAFTVVIGSALNIANAGSDMAFALKTVSASPCFRQVLKCAAVEDANGTTQALNQLFDELSSAYTTIGQQRLIQTARLHALGAVDRTIVAVIAERKRLEQEEKGQEK